jgi:hypothetical protein
MDKYKIPNVKTFKYSEQSIIDLDNIIEYIAINKSYYYHLTPFVPFVLGVI